MKNFILILVLATLLFSCSSENDTNPPDDNNNQPFPTAIVDVTNPITGKTWMDRNLGASQAATSSTDALAYGDLYQWGRSTDGHQIRTSPTSSTLSNTDQPSPPSFIRVLDPPYDWRSPQNNNLWQGVNGINNPCPIGYRLPTITEWQEEMEVWSSIGSDGAFASPLKLTIAGRRNYENGSLLYVGNIGHYWSSTEAGVSSRLLSFSFNSVGANTLRRAHGASVRCIKD